MKTKIVATKSNIGRNYKLNSLSEPMSLAHLEGPDYTVGLSEVLDPNETEKKAMFDTDH